jgi:predicted alpha/beta-fold hydrolase
MRPFEPIVRNPHLLTILGNFWPRGYDFTPFPEQRRLIRTDPDTQVLVTTQRPLGAPLGEVVFLHGLEGSGDAGYMRSAAWQALSAGFVAHRFHMRTCGGTAQLCKTLYHGGLTSDLRVFLREIQAAGTGLPVFLTGFSLGGNVSLKLAGEEGETDLIHGVCAVSTPIDLAACARRIGEPDNRLYERRFLARMKERVIATGRYTRADLAGCDTLWEIDDRITAPSFGFGSAANYYATQSSQNFLHRIRVPTALIQAKDDSFIPFEIFQHPAVTTNPHLSLMATEYGGHLGFISRRAPRFWVDFAVMDFIQAHLRTPAGVSRNSQCER